MLHKKRVPCIDTVDILANAMEVDTYELFLPPNREGTKGERIDVAYEEEILTAVRRMSEKKKKLLLLYVHLLEDLDSG